MRKMPHENKLAVEKGPPIISKKRFYRTLTIILLMAVVLQVPADAVAQSAPANVYVTFSGKHVTLKQVFNEIKKQTNYDVLYNPEQVDTIATITVNAKNQPIEAFLKTILVKQPLTYTFINSTIVIFRKPEGQPNSSFEDPMGRDISGAVFDEKTTGPLAGVSIVLNHAGKGTQTDSRGLFTLKNVNGDDSITFSIIGYESVSLQVRATGNTLGVAMKIATNNLDEAVVQAYGITSRRLATGNITKVRGEEIRNQPVMNPLLALQGRVPGMIITPTQGNASSPVKIEIRGRNSLNKTFSGEPLYIIDGVPRAALDVSSAIQYQSGVSPGFVQGGISQAGGQSILFGMNPNDIESIEVLKDGDATAIYGSRAANGVIIITTKKAKAGKTSFMMGIQQGVTDVPHHSKMMNTQQYLAVRREAFRNDGIVPDISNAPDLVAWDTTRYTDWQNKLLTLGRSTNINGEVSGGDYQNAFRLSSNYSTQKSVFDQSGKEEALTTAATFSHISQDQKLSATLRIGYTYTFVDAIAINDMALPPNAPPVYDSTGRMNYAEWNVGTNASVGNRYPFTRLLQPSITKTNNLQTSLAIGYDIIKGLKFSGTASYSNAQSTNDWFIPISSTDPALGSLGTAIYGSSKFANWSLSPLLTYTRLIGKGRLEIFGGASLESQSTSTLNTTAFGFTNDELIQSVGNALFQQSTEGYGLYKYAAAFGRINFNWENKYIINFNGRRDGSSRFATDRQYGNFGSVGASWNISQEKWMRQILPSWFSFFKIRSSYALTGNDGIGDYQYLSQWATTTGGPSGTLYDYDGVRPFVPIHAVNQDYHWEANKKLEAAVSLGFLRDRLNLDVVYFRNVSGDQLTTLPTPAYTGFPSVVANSPAKVENTGIDISLDFRIIQDRKFSWSAAFNIGFSKNKLLAYPGLESSPYATQYKIGQSLNTRYMLHYIGIDPLTGDYSFADYNKDGFITSNFNQIPGETTDDRYVAMNYNPKYDGGFRTELSYKGFNLGLVFIFRKQMQVNLFGNYPPGKMINMYLPADALKSYWRTPGDHAIYPRFTTMPTALLVNSDGSYTDGSFLRLNNIVFGYTLSEKFIKKAGFKSCRFSVNANNIFTITRYKGIDPNVLDPSSLPPARIIVGNLSFTF
ncbi:SusC/RagA family TonB-linked outer membrane protein [Flavitalea flava]